MGRGAYSSTSQRGCFHWLPPNSSFEARGAEPLRWPVGRPGRSGSHPSPESCSMGCESCSSRPTTPTAKRVSLYQSEDKSLGYLVGVGIRRPRLERHPATRRPGNVLPSGSHVVAAGQPDPSLAEAVHPSVGPLGRRRRWRRWSTARSLLVRTTHGRHCCRSLLKVGGMCERMS